MKLWEKIVKREELGDIVVHYLCIQRRETHMEIDCAALSSRYSHVKFLFSLVPANRQKTK